MDEEFKDQQENTNKRNIIEFNTRPDLVGIRNLYKNNFDTIRQRMRDLGKFGHKLVIEDISKIDNNLEKSIFENRQLLEQINNAIAKGSLTSKGIE